MAEDPLESSLRRIPIETFALGFLTGLGAGWLLDPLSGIIIFAGSGLAALSFISLKSFIDRYLYKNKTVLLRRAIILYSLRLLLICMIFLTIIFFFKGKIIAFVVGFSLLLVSILVEAVRNLANIKPWKV
ncbi:MAG: hypothetical protein JHC32_06215 [Candidatus Aminicenantes bacterium]|jgi:Bacterial ATP synthase I.|nr:hypothetical protein [Candidatus Aminicenantes bacterium]